MFYEFVGKKWFKWFVLILIFPLLGHYVLEEAPILMRANKLKKLENKTTGRLISIEPKQNIYQTLTGNYIKLKGYYLTYSFQLEEQVYKKTEYIEVSISNKIALEKLTSGKNNKLIIKYSEADNEDFMVDL
ncbi:hypothetical protein [Flexithrix dorotheae]|uniref:hypothetical protein n=1 Tax=Flexithrix dorotheae TaxID=70993 RepID=UPI0003608D9A|nr:hypothetical protein [Flexithrix dorotheae]